MGGAKDRGCERTKKAALSQAQQALGSTSLCVEWKSLSFIATEELWVSLRLVNGTGGSQSRKVWHFWGEHGSHYHLKHQVHELERTMTSLSSFWEERDRHLHLE